MSKKSEFVKGLRELADFLEQRDSDMRLRRHTFNFTYYGQTEKDLEEKVRFIGTCEKFENQETIGIRRKFGPITLQFTWYRGGLCKRVKVGEERYEGKYETVYVKKPVVEAKYKWVCPTSFLRACCEDKP